MDGLRSSAFLFALFAVSFPRAQAPTLTAATDVGVFARDQQGAAHAFIPVGTVIAARTAASAFLGRHAWSHAEATPRGSGMFSLTTTGTVIPNFGNASGRDAGTTASSDPQNLAQGPHAWVLHVPTTLAAPKNLVVQFWGQVAPGARLSLATKRPCK